MRSLALTALAGLLLLAPAARAQAPGGPARPGGPLVERLELRGARITDAARLIGEVAGWNVVASPEAGEREVTLVLQNISVRAAVDALCRASGVWYREEDGVIRIMTAEELREDLVIQRTTTTQVFTLLHPNGLAVASAIRDLFGDRVSVSYGIDDSLTPNFNGGANGANNGGFNNGGGGFNNGGGGFNNGGGGFNNGAALGQGQNPFSTQVGGINNGGLGGTTGNGGPTLEDDRQARRIDDSVSAAQMSRVELDAQGRPLPGSGLDELTEQRPPIAVALNRRHNVLIVRTSDPDALQEISALIGEIDRPLPQVLLEMKILELRLRDQRDLALDVDWVEDPARANLPTGKPANPLDLSQVTGLTNVAGLGNFPVTGGTLVYQYLNEHVRVRLQALEQEGRVSVLATPLLMCANTEVARIFVGEERPLVRSFELQTTTTNGVAISQVVPTVELRDIGNTLRIIPRINADRTVALTVVQDVSSVNVGGATLPVPTGNGVQLVAIDTVNTANLQGTVVAKDGLTLAIGGLIRKELSDQQTGIPYLMDLPLIGWAFGSTQRVEEQRELVLLITPHVITTPAEADERSRRRMAALSLHPYHDIGDRALQVYGVDQVPGSADYRLFLEDHILGAPEPIR